MRFFRAAIAAALLALPLASAACAGNTCLFTYNGVCKLSSCGDRQSFDNTRKVCACSAGYLVVGGRCLTQVEANNYCGKGMMWTPQGCQKMVCNTGFVIDLELNQCVPKAAVDQKAGVGPNQTLSCPQGTQLVVNGGQTSCVPNDQLCSRDEVWNGQGCVKVQQCPTGFDLDRTSMQCVAVSKPPEGNDSLGTVDVVSWSKTNFGPTGGPGAPGLCGQLAKKPLSFGVLPGGSIRVVVSLQLSLPGGLVENAQVRTSGIVEASRQPVIPKGAQEIQIAADSLVQTLRAQKAKATVGEVPTTVTCLIVNGAAPVVVPSTGGA